MLKTDISFILNDKQVNFPGKPGMVTLDFIRTKEGLTGTKEGCREGDCGACTVLLGELAGNKVTYKAVVSCLLPLGDIKGKHLVTIEGLNLAKPNIIQNSIMNEGATQCGFCTPGIVVSFTGFLLNNKEFKISEAINSIEGNICRCTGYMSLKRTAENLVNICSKKLNKDGNRIRTLIELGVLPEYFKDIPGRLKKIQKSDVTESIKFKRTATVIAGGTDIYVQQPDELVEKDIAFISHYKKIKEIKFENNSLTIGAGVTVEELKDSPVIKKYLPELVPNLDLISSTQIRNRATIGGNIMNASPIGDIAIILLGLGSQVNLMNGGKIRKKLLKDFFLGYKKLDIKENEIIGSVSIPIIKKSYFSFEKVSRRKYLDIASVNTAVSLRVKKNIIIEISLSAGGVSPVPYYLLKTCTSLIGKELNIKNLKASLDIMEKEISPISDVRGSAKYKRLLLRQLILAHFIKLFPAKFNSEDML